MSPDKPKFIPRKDYQPQVTTEQLGSMVGSSLNNLVEAVKTGNMDRLTEYFKFSSRFHNYSRGNQQLIYMQCPEATRVASYAKWKEEGFQVRKMDKDKGEKGISILVPIPPTGYRREKRVKDLAEGEKEKTEIGFITHNFRVGTVFDTSHLIPEDQERVPAFFSKIEGDHQDIHERLIRAVQANGIKYQESLDTGGTGGYSAGGLIVVRSDLLPGNKAAVTAHEWGHEILHKEQERRELSKQVKECHAEATAYVVLSHFGIEIPYSAEYLQHWGNTPDTLRKELDLIHFAASQIIMKVEAVSGGGAAGLEIAEGGSE